MKVGNCAMLKLYKSYSITIPAGVTTKLTQQYINLFRNSERVGRFIYRLVISDDWRIHLVDSDAQLKPAFEPFNNPFWRLHSDYPPAVFVNGNNDSLRCFEINCLLNK